MVEQWAMDEKCLWVHFGVPCGTASAARFRRLSKNQHGPPVLRTYRWPDGIPSLRGVNLQRVRMANRLYSFMSFLILKLHGRDKAWTVENPWTSLLWCTSYWVKLRHLDPYYCELHNCMFGGQRLKRTCLASNQDAILSLGLKCDGQHLHAPWTINDGVFDTSLEAEYTPMLAKALASTILESLAGEYKLANVQQFSKKLKTSHFQALAAAKQPTKPLALAVVPEFSHVVVISCVPTSVEFAISQHETGSCIHIQLGSQIVWLSKQSKLLRKTFKEGDMCRLTKLVVEKTPSLQGLSDLDSATRKDSRYDCNFGCRCEGPCKAMTVMLEDSEFRGVCCDWVFGIRWTPEDFVRQSLSAEHPFENFSGLLDDVRWACDKVSSMSAVDIINMRCSKLGSWLRLVKDFGKRESDLKTSMSVERRRILEKKQICLMKHVIEEEGYHDVTLADDLAGGFSLVGETPKSHVLPPKM